MQMLENALKTRSLAIVCLHIFGCLASPSVQEAGMRAVVDKLLPSDSSDSERCGGLNNQTREKAAARLEMCHICSSGESSGLSV